MPYLPTGGMMRKDGAGSKAAMDRDKPIKDREEDFPYDRPIVYGQPTMPGKHSGRGADNGKGFVPVPRDSSNIDSWDEVEEAVGTPVDFGKSNAGTRTSSIPGGPGELGGGVAPSGSAWGMGPADNGVFGTKSSQTSSRMGLGEAWVSLSSLPLGSISDDSIPMDDEMLDSLQSQFGQACDDLERATSGFSRAEKILLMFDLDPENAANSVADDSSVDPDSMYRVWRDDALPAKGDEDPNVKLSMGQMESMVRAAVAEAKKKKDEDDFPPGAAERLFAGTGYTTDPALDFSEPLGDRNRLKRQGSDPGWGPTTEQKVRTVVRRIVREAMGAVEQPSAPNSGLSSATKMKIQRLSSKYPWFTEWMGQIGKSGGDVVQALSTAEDGLTSKGARGVDFIDAIMVAAEMLRGK